MLTSDPEPVSARSDSGEKMTIAFRYQNLPTGERESTHQFGHYYDLSKNMPENDIQNADIDYWTGKIIAEGTVLVALLALS